MPRLTSGQRCRSSFFNGPSLYWPPAAWVFRSKVHVNVFDSLIHVNLFTMFVNSSAFTVCSLCMKMGTHIYIYVHIYVYVN